MTPQPSSISVTVPLGLALDRVKRLLFQPFDLRKWFVIGFCAWLAHLGEGGFSGTSFHSGSPSRGTGNVRAGLEQARDYLWSNLYWILPLVGAVLILSLGLGLLFLWLSSRGRFMFVHCVALDKSEVGVPWHRYARAGNSLFWFRLVLALIGMALTLPFVGLIVVLIWRMVARGEPSVPAIAAVGGIVLALVVVGVVFAIIQKFTTDFVVPIMLLRGSRTLEGWRELRGLLSANAGRFILYLIFQIVLSMAIGAILLTLVIVTCCIAGCLMAIPYVGTVLLLPVLAFKRSYSLHYLAQFGPPYDVFPPGGVPPAQGLAPVA